MIFSCFRTSLLRGSFWFFTQKLLLVIFKAPYGIVGIERIEPELTECNANALPLYYLSSSKGNFNLSTHWNSTQVSVKLVENSKVSCPKIVCQ